MRVWLRVILRHVLGYGVIFPLLVLAILVQALVMDPVFGNRAAIPRLMYRTIARVFGIRVAINPASAPMATDGPVMFLANHLSRIDFVVAPHFPDAGLMMNAAFFRTPLIGPLVRLFARSAGIVGTHQSRAGKARDLAALAGTLDSGRSLFLFPEGIQTDGRRLLRYSRGPAEIFFDEEARNRYPAIGTARVQPVVLRVRSVEGREVIGDANDWSTYTIARGRTGIFKGILRASKVGSTVLDVLTLPPLDPADFATPEALMDRAHDLTLAHIAPGQARTLTREEWRRRLDVGDFSL